MEEFDPRLVQRAHDQLTKALAKEAFAPAAGIAQAPPQGGMPMDPAMAGGAPPMPPAGGGAPPMDPAMAGGAPPMDPAMAGGAPPMPGGEGAMPPVQVSLEDLMALFAQISQEVGGGGGGGGGAPNEGSPDVSGALDDIGSRLEAIEGALGLSAPAPGPAEAGAMPPMPEAPVMPDMPPMGEAMAPMMDATAAPMPGMPVAASKEDGQVKAGKAEKIGDLIAKLRRK